MKGNFVGYIRFKRDCIWHDGTSERKATPDMLFLVVPWTSPWAAPNSYLIYWKEDGSKPTESKGENNWAITRSMLREEFEKGNIEIIKYETV